MIVRVKREKTVAVVGDDGWSSFDNLSGSRVQLQSQVDCVSSVDGFYVSGD